MDLLTLKILSKDPSAIQMSEHMGEYATSAIKPLINHNDPDVKLIALYSLNQSGGYECENFFATALQDESPSVRVAALNSVRKSLSREVYPQLLKIYDKVPDAQHRQELVLLIARSSFASINDLINIYQNEQDPLAKEGCTAALAKLGESNSQAEILNRLKSAKDHELMRLLEYVEYIGQVWALTGLTSVLNDKTPLLGLGICNPPPGCPSYLRACDIAVNLIAKISQVSFSFYANEMTNYTDSQLSEAHQLIHSLAFL